MVLEPAPGRTENTPALNATSSASQLLTHPAPPKQAFPKTASHSVWDNFQLHQLSPTGQSLSCPKPQYNNILFSKSRPHIAISLSLTCRVECDGDPLAFPIAHGALHFTDLLACGRPLLNIDVYFTFPQGMIFNVGHKNLLLSQKHCYASSFNDMFLLAV